MPLSVRAQERSDGAVVPYLFELPTRYAILTNRQRTLGPAARTLRDAIRSVAGQRADA